MNGLRHHTQPRAGQHHHGAFGSRQVLQIFGMAWEGEARRSQRGFLDRGGNDGRRFSAHSCLRGVGNGRRNGGSVAGRWLARHACRPYARVDQSACRNTAAGTEHSRVTDQFERASAHVAIQRAISRNGDFGADTGRFAHCDVERCGCACALSAFRHRRYAADRAYTGGPASSPDLRTIAAPPAGAWASGKP